MKINPHPRFPTMFITGYRVEPGGTEAEKVGTVIVKGTYTNIAEPVAVLGELQLPVLKTDIPFNLLFNSDFENHSVSNGDEEWYDPWQLTDAEALQVDGGVEDSAKCLGLISCAAGARVSQTVDLLTPLKGRQFKLSFWGRTHQDTSPITISGFTLKSQGDHQICQLSAELNEDFKRFTSAVGTWPEDESASVFEVILPGSGDPEVLVYYDRVLVEEMSDAGTVFRFEHDLVPYKPFADLIVLDTLTIPEGHDSGEWHIEIIINSLSVASRIIEIDNPDQASRKTVLGWAPRGKEPRLLQAGENLEEFKPDERFLPEQFDNLFFNGYDRKISGAVPFGYFADGAQVDIKIQFFPEGNGDPISLPEYNVKLPPQRPVIKLQVINAQGQQATLNKVPKLDTLIVEPSLDRYMVVWREVWKWDDEQIGSYHSLTVEGGDL